MSKIEALCRRLFCKTCPVYDKFENGVMKLGEVWYRKSDGEIEYVYIGKETLWIKKIK